MKMRKSLYKIAEKNLLAVEERGDLETRYNDSEDFLDVAVWTLQKMLEEAYELGKKQGEKQCKKN
ncbi:TPA: hypothetical protein TXT63_000734 [Streptococcus suis]|nr:hypothetical protein [Streptococcus suis]HEM6179001.1 hypothetical protein [Streptococcus suis]HEM6356432.1 hypothetical protein [Streptococcus suis]HEM6380566.1 hypothetical protein [Streptococcus suis]HEM6409786.1 hypothetical protein [Streptococcus suis]